MLFCKTQIYTYIIAQIFPKGETTVPVFHSLNLSAFTEKFSSDLIPNNIFVVKNAQEYSEIMRTLFSLNQECSISASGENEKNSEREAFLKLLYKTLVDNEVNETVANQMVDELEVDSAKEVKMEHILSDIYQKIILKFG